MKDQKKTSRLRLHNISVYKYVLSFVVFITAIVCFVTIATIQVVVSRAIPDEVRRDMAAESRHVEKSLKFEDEVLVSDDFSSDYEGYTFAVADEYGEEIIGHFPKGIEVPELKERSYFFDRFKTPEGVFYVKRDIVRSDEIRRAYSGKRIYIYGFTDASKVSTVYNRIRKTAFIIIIISFLVLVIFMVDITKRMVKPIDKMYESAKRVSDSMDFAETIDEESIFIEINTLTHAYNELFDRIRISYETQKRFNSDVSHELRTPIAVMSAQCQVARQKYKSDKEALEMITVLERQTNIMNDLVTQLLQLSRIENDSIELYSEPVNMVDLVDVVCEDLEISFDGFNSFVKKVDIEEISGNNVLMITVVRNLLSNAVRYNVNDNPIDIAVKAQGDDILIRVKDRGIGISKENLPIVFDAFFRGEMSRSSEGFGLGLTLTKRIVECYGGRISVRSEEGKGSEFIVRMPIKYITD